MAAVTVLRHVAIMAACVIMVVTSAPAEHELDGRVKRSGERGCTMKGKSYKHGEIRVLNLINNCMQLVCTNGRFRPGEKGCKVKGECIPLNSLYTKNCRSLRCLKKKKGFLDDYYFEPTNQDRCLSNGKCVPKNTPFTKKSKCQFYRCVDTGRGGYRIQPEEPLRCQIGSTCLQLNQYLKHRCRSVRCVKEMRGGFLMLVVKPAQNDTCELSTGKCVPKNVPFENTDCKISRCVATSGLGIRIEPEKTQPKIKDSNGNCVPASG